MIKKILWVVGVLVILFAGFVVFTIATTKKHSPAESISYEGAVGEFTVDYCRPYKKGREIFGVLLPYDTYWRTGANGPTLITIPAEVVFGGRRVEAGKYRLYTIPSEKEWTVVLNSEIEEWGYFEPDYTLDIAKVIVPVIKTGACTEQFLIAFNESSKGVNLSLSWDMVKVSIPIEF